MMGFKNPFVKDIHVQVYDTEINISLARFRRNLPEAQRWLTSQVAADCTNFIPFRNGTLRSSVMFPEGLDGGQIEWNTPYAHYMYEGEVYINPKHNASGFIGADGMWHGWKGKKVPSGKPLSYYTAGTGDHWFDRAYEAYGDSWIEGVKKIARFF